MEQKDFKMSKEQIEEMAKIACVGFREGDCDNCKSVGICSSYTISKKLYNAGYRKQSEGEWIDVDTFIYRYKCSLCGEIKLGKMTSFCPNCGAKMKGGAE